MMGSTQHRSLSPMSSRQNPNPNSRSFNQEREGFGGSKSLNGHPFAKSSLISQRRVLVPNTPLNSPAEYSRRSSFGRECGGDLKENNERDPNIRPSARAKSPSINTKGAKNFMSPTISAASKINPSPKKKVLGERNEAIRTSASLSDGKFYFFSKNSLELDNKNAPKSDMEHSPCSATLYFDKADKEIHPRKSGSGFGFGEVQMEASQADMVVLSPEMPPHTVKSSETLPISEMPKMVGDKHGSLSINSSVCSSPCITAPLDADPFVPPYDPKTNYLSPRPQFLHYNPNRRIESFVDQGIRLEDDFTSESVTETENSSEEVLSGGDSHNDQEDAASSVGIPYGATAPSSEIITSESQLLQEEVKAKLDNKPKSVGFSTWKSLAMLLLILLGSLSVATTLCPGFANVVHGDKTILQIYGDSRVVAELAGERFSDLLENGRVWIAHSADYSRVVAKIARERLNDLLENGRVWSAHSTEYLSQILQNVREVDNLSPMKFGNMTGWEEEEVWNHAGATPYITRTEDKMWITEDGDRDLTVMDSDSDREEHQAFTEKQSYRQPEYSRISAQEFEEGAVQFSEGMPEMPSYPQPEIDSTVDDAELIALEGGEQQKEDESSVGHNSLIEVDHGLVNNENPVAFMIEQPSSVHEAANLVGDSSETSTETHGFSVDVGDELSQNGIGDVRLLSKPQEVPEIQPLETIETEPLPEPQVPRIQCQETTGKVPVGDELSQNDFGDERLLSKPQEFSEIQPLEIIETEPFPEPQVPQIQSQETTGKVPISEGGVNSIDGLALEPTAESSQLQGASETNLTRVVAAITLLIVSLLVAAAFMYVKPSKDTNISAQSVAEGKTRYTHVASNMEHCETASAWSEPTEVDMIDDSCPSEMSSFQTSTYTNTKPKGIDEAQSQQQKSSKRSLKRESLVASSDYTKTSSYGSFTTYSILPHGDDEVVTPIRRSSRIRSKVTSP